MSTRHGKKGGKSLEFPDDLFASLALGELDDAVTRLRQASINESGEPSPTAKKLMESGEWDAREVLQLVFVSSDACAGRVGSDGLRFCGKTSLLCSAAGHSSTKIGTIKAGWYISFGKNLGTLITPSLPPHEEGGPITASIAARLTGPKAFKLTRGQWKFIIDSWHALKVETISDTSEEENLLANDPFIIDLPPKSAKTTDHLSDDDKTGLRTGATTAPNDGDELHAMRLQFAEQQREVEACFEQMRAMRTKMEHLVEANKSLTERYFTIEASMQRLYQKNEGDVASCGAMIRRVRDHVDEIETKYVTNRGSGQDSGGGNHQELEDKLEVLEDAMFAPAGAFARFKESFIEFKDRLESGGGIECNGATFGSYHEFMTWYQRAKPSLDIYLDALAYMHAIRAPVVHTDDATKQRELQMKTSVTTALENTVITSFDTVLPSILVGGGGKKGDGGKGGAYDWLLGYIKSYEVWKPPGTTHGVSHQITNGVKSVSKRIAELRKQYSDNKVVMLSLGLCQDSADFCSEFVRFVNDQQEELANNTGYSAEQIWEMQIECIQKIIEELHEAREAYGDTGQTEKGNYVWGMLRAWQIQQRYMTNHFKDDPALTGVLVRRLLMQGQDTSVKKKMAKIDTLENKINEQKNHTTTEIGKVKAEINKVKEEVNKLKK